MHCVLFFRLFCFTFGYKHEQYSNLRPVADLTSWCRFECRTDSFCVGCKLDIVCHVVIRNGITRILRPWQATTLVHWRDFMDPFASDSAHLTSAFLWCHSIYFVLSTWLGLAATEMWDYSLYK